MYKIALFLSMPIILASCLHSNPNLDLEGKDILSHYTTHKKHIFLPYRDTIYIPIYSEIYSQSKDVKFNLTATLSIRNTSLQDTMYIQDIDYYDTYGTLVRNYLDEILQLNPLQSIEYVIEEEDTEGGTGANFIVNWGAENKSINPLFQGVMISTNGQQGISFITQGVSIRQK